jgi:hypothetical protein
MESDAPKEDPTVIEQVGEPCSSLEQWRQQHPDEHAFILSLHPNRNTIVAHGTAEEVAIAHQAWISEHPDWETKSILSEEGRPVPFIAQSLKAIERGEAEDEFYFEIRRFQNRHPDQHVFYLSYVHICKIMAHGKASEVATAYQVWMAEHPESHNQALGGPIPFIEQSIESQKKEQEESNREIEEIIHKLQMKYPDEFLLYVINYRLRIVRLIAHGTETDVYTAYTEWEDGHELLHIAIPLPNLKQPFKG